VRLPVPLAVGRRSWHLAGSGVVSTTRREGEAMPPKVARNQERVAEDAHRIATLRRRARAETGDILARADEADGEAGRAVPSDEPPPEATGTSPG
jgi:hypothetical protein